MDRLFRVSQTDSAAEVYAEDQMMLSEDAVIEIVQAEYVSDYTLKINFRDGKERIIDFEPFLRKARSPLILEYLDPKKFANFRLEYGDLIWDYYGLCFPI